jgi:hypothetical protein
MAGGETDSSTVVIVLFPFFFAGLWLAVTMVLGAWSGWNSLQQSYPDRQEQPIDRMRMQSGMLGSGSSFNPWGGVSYSGCLRFDVCPSGLRVAVWRIFGPLQRPFFVPWNEIRVEKFNLFFFSRYRLNFGNRNDAGLSIGRRAFERIAANSPLNEPA